MPLMEAFPGAVTVDNYRMLTLDQIADMTERLQERAAANR